MAYCGLVLGGNVSKTTLSTEETISEPIISNELLIIIDPIFELGECGEVIINYFFGFTYAEMLTSFLGNLLRDIVGPSTI